MPHRKEVIIGIDLEGASIKALAVNAKNKILATDKKETETGRKPKAVIKEIAELVKSTAKKESWRLGFEQESLTWPVRRDTAFECQPTMPLCSHGKFLGDTCRERP